MLIWKRGVSLCGIALVVGMVMVLAGAVVLEAADAPWEQFDLEGRTVSISTRFTGITPLGDRGEFDWYDPDPRLEAHIQEVEERFNCNVEFVGPIPDGDLVDTILAEVLAGDPVFDVIVIPSSALYPLAAEGALFPLDDVLEQEYYESLVPGTDVTEGLYVRDKLYGFERWPEPNVGHAVMWNKDLFERKGFPDLYEVVEDGEWTWDLFLELARESTLDTTGDGEVDQWGVNFIGDEIVFLPTNNASTTILEDGRVHVALDQPEALEALGFIQDLYQEGLAISSWGDSPTAMAVVWSDAVQYDWLNGEEDWGVVPLPMGPEADDYVAPGAGTWMAVLPVTVRNPRAKLEVYNALMGMTEPYWDEDMESRIEHIWYEGWRSMIVYDRESIEYMRWTAENRTYIPHVALLEGANFTEGLARIIDGDDVSTVIAEINPLLQSALDDLYDQ